MEMSSYEMLFYAGITVMLLGVLLAGSFLFYFRKRKNKIKRKLDEEYGNPQHYNIKDEG